MLCKFPQILSNLRRQKGLSQKKVASELGISPALLSHYENGIRECGLDFLLRLADYYSVSCDYLLGKSEIKNPTVYETEPEALALDELLKTARNHNEQVYKNLCDISDVYTYNMVRSLCDTAVKSEAFSFDLENTDYKNFCPATAFNLYSQLTAFGKEKSRLSLHGHDTANMIVKRAEKIIKKNTHIK